MTDYYDHQGNPVDDDDFIALMGADSRRVAKTDVGGYHISTVHLVINHNFSGVGPPIIFETMVFAGDSALDQYMERYSTEAEALAGHENIAGMVRALEGVTE